MHHYLRPVQYLFRFLDIEVSEIWDTEVSAIPEKNLKSYIFVVSVILGLLIIAPFWVEHSNLGCITRGDHQIYSCSGSRHYTFTLFLSGIFMGLVPVAIGISQFFFHGGIPLKKGGRISPKLHALILTLLLPVGFVEYQSTKKEVAAKMKQRLEQSE